MQNTVFNKITYKYKIFNFFKKVSVNIFIYLQYFTIHYNLFYLKFIFIFII